MKQSLSALRRNIKAGTRLALFRPCKPDDFAVSLDQLVLLIALNFLLAFVFDWLLSLPRPEFQSYAMAANGLDVLLFLFAAYLVSRLLLGRQDALRLAIYIYSMSPFFYLLWVILERFGVLLPLENVAIYAAAYVVYLFWVVVAIGWAVTRLAGGYSRRVPAALLVMVLTWVLPVYYFAADTTLWYPVEEDSVDVYAAYRTLDVERMFDNQPALLAGQLQLLQAQRADRADLYFVGFAGYALQDVFRNEIEFARTLFDERFDTGGRSLMLINNLDTRKELPLATSLNLERTLRHLGDVIDRDNDVVVLFLTSHGGRSELSVNFWPLWLNDLTPVMLRQYLDDAGIKWRIIMVSACYSGSFIDALKDDYTAIMTASSAEKTSFGCDDSRELTYFGEALLQHQLQTQFSIAAAFEATAAEIRQREKAEQLESSQPQIHIGTAMREKLRQLESVLTAGQLAQAPGSVQP